MITIQDQFESQVLYRFFEQDTHFEVQNLKIDRIHVIHGETKKDDITLVLYKGSPNISFYNSYGRVIDIDHYLPDTYRSEDEVNSINLIENLRNVSLLELKDPDLFLKILDEVMALGNGALWNGLRQKFGLESELESDNLFFEQKNYESTTTKLKDFLLSSFTNFYDLLEEYILVLQHEKGAHVYITPLDNIVIAPLNKRSGIAVMIELRDINGVLQPHHKWTITRTSNPSKLEQALVFRSSDIQDYFNEHNFKKQFETDRYHMTMEYGFIVMDSILDNTENLLSVSLVNNCFHFLATDMNVVIALTKVDEITIINTHVSIIPQKWSKRIKLPIELQWVRVEDNLNIAFGQKLSGELVVIDISSVEPSVIYTFEAFAQKFELNQAGNLIVKDFYLDRLLLIETNVQDLILHESQVSFTKIFQNLTHLFKGESLFTKTTYAKPVPKEPVKDVAPMISVLEVSKYDFETNLEHLIVAAGDDYEKLLEVKNKIAIARQNISNEIQKYSELEGVVLVGQRLKTAVNTIIRPTENRLNNIIDIGRAEQILNETKEIRENLDKLEDPGAYHEILNKLHEFSTEFSSMDPETIKGSYTDFQLIQQEISVLFSEQVTKDGAQLRTFILGEINTIEAEIKHTFNEQSLELVLSTHPAAIELFSLLKQPYILKNIGKEKQFSPAQIQLRLHKAIEQKRNELHVEKLRKEAELQAEKMQLADMVNASILFFVKNHTSSFSDVELSYNASYQAILYDIRIIEERYRDIRLSTSLRRTLEKKIVDRNRLDLEKLVSYEGKYAFIQNDPDLYVDLESTILDFPKWNIQLIPKKGVDNVYQLMYVRDSDLEVYRPSTEENLRANKAFEISEEEYPMFFESYDLFVLDENSKEKLEALLKIYEEKEKIGHFPQFAKNELKSLLPSKPVQAKALHCALVKKQKDHLEKTRKRNVPLISSEFIDETPYFKKKLYEFIIKAKLQRLSDSGIILLSGPPSTGKSAFLKYVSSITNREYFEHAADKWQTKNSLVTAIKFGENGPYSVPAGFTKAITTANSLISIEEIKEWPEALRKSLNPFFAGSKIFLGPDGTNYKIGKNILLCAAANLGSMYRQDDEPFTADFWSRIEVVEYNYAPHEIDEAYLKDLFGGKQKKFITIKDMTRHFFKIESAPSKPDDKAMFITQSLIEFILLPKADENVKRDSLQNNIRSFFSEFVHSSEYLYSPEEATKVALRRMTLFQGFKTFEFYDLYNHFINKGNLKTKRISVMQTTETKKYEHYRIVFLCLFYTELCLRELRLKFVRSAGQTEIEGTNREFIQIVYLLGLMGELNK